VKLKTPNFTIFSLLFLFALYLALTLNLALNNLVLGALVALLVYRLIRPGTARDLDLHALPRALVGIARYVLYVIVDVIKCGITVAKIVLDPKLPIRPGIIAIKSGFTSEIGTALSAHAITITPGEMVVEIGDDGTMYTHCLDAIASSAGGDAAQATRRAMLTRILAGES
jgi:multicomponent Na+:H+ antiporter subunit E